MEGRYCANCEHPLGLHTRFCPECGRPTRETARVPTPEVDVPGPTLRPTRRIGLPEGVFLSVLYLALLVVYAGFVLFVGSWIAVGALFIVGALTGSSFITFAVTGVVLLIYLIIAVLFGIGALKALS